MPKLGDILIGSFEGYKVSFRWLDANRAVAMDRTNTVKLAEIEDWQDEFEWSVFEDEQIFYCAGKPSTGFADSAQAAADKCAEWMSRLHDGQQITEEPTQDDLRQQWDQFPGAGIVEMVKAIFCDQDDQKYWLLS